ncbi:MAG: hypothetical protein ACXADW_10785 [Candidatus Hodarchaeales archaeon]|jgi:hypothetical protein
MIQLTIYVSDITTVMATFTHIRIYTSSSETGTYTHLAYVTLVAGQSTYEYIHVAGTTDTWYKSSYWSSSTESSLSDAVQGSVSELYHYPTYPSEVDFSSDEDNIIRKIRRYIGDLKGLERLYISSADDSDSTVQDDGVTIDLEKKGWPVYIDLNGTEKTTDADPIVQGYQFLTFSGTIGDSDYPIDIWYYTFKFSDRQVYEAYGDAFMPVGLSATTVTQDHLILQASIDLLENMNAEDIVEDGAMVRDGATTYDPEPGLRERDAMIKRLRKMLDDLIKRAMFGDLTGVLLD